jgi:hypothetical protein
MIHVTNNILDGLAGPAGPQGIPGAAGPAPFTILGAYNNGADYTFGDAVYYNGGTYVRTGNPNNPGYPPTPGEINASWTPIADKGASGTAGATTTYASTWAGTGLAYTNTPVTARYIKNGDLIQVSISVVCTTVTNFGTGGYTITLPFAPVSAPLIRGTITIGTTIYDLLGICSPGSTIVELKYWSGNQTSIAANIDHANPGTFTTSSKFDLYGSYIAQP